MTPCCGKRQPETCLEVVNDCKMPRLRAGFFKQKYWMWICWQLPANKDLIVTFDYRHQVFGAILIPRYFLHLG